jgi:hypothetical protein
MGRGLELSGFIKENRDALAGRWLDAVIGSYSADTGGFIKGKDDRIANPLGHAIREMVDAVLRCLGEGCDEQALGSAMFPVIQMRAVQDFTPSEAVAFVGLFRNSVVSLAMEKEAGPELIIELDDVVLGLMSRAFDLYSDCREKLWEIKIEEIKRNLYMFLRKSDMVELQNGSG